MSRLATTSFALFVFALSAAFVPAAQAQKIAAYPSPNVTTASNETTISFRGLKPSSLGKITVRGSRSGLHRGRLKAHSDGRGVSFIPRRDFTMREQVTVTLPRHTFFGVKPGSHTYRFEIGLLQPKGWRAESQVPPEGVRPLEWTTYKSFPLKVPKTRVNLNEPGASNGSIFFAPRTNGPMIVDRSGELVYYRPGQRVTDFRKQSYMGKPVLTWWRRAQVGKHVESNYAIAGQNYKVIKRFEAGNGYTSDPHEFTMASRDTAFVNSFRTVMLDLRRLGGMKNTPVLDQIAQEIDLRTNQVIWEWHSLGNVAINESYWPIPKQRNFKPTPYCYFHMNSIERDKDGNILISARHTSALYKINRLTGKVMWRLGGKRSDFKLAKGFRPGYQHDFRRHPDGSFTILDNGAAGGPLKPFSKVTRGQVIRLDQKKKTMKLVRDFIHPQRLLAPSQGNLQMLSNGNAFVGWGPRKYCTEFTPDGKAVYDIEYFAVAVTYRCFSDPWVGTPDPEAIGVKSERQGENSRVWVSWNGDTRVRTWRVLAGGTQLTAVAQADRDGFETSIPVTGQPARFRLVGLDAEGKVIGRSKLNPLGKLSR